MTVASIIPEIGLFSNPSRSWPTQTLAERPNQATPAVNASPGSTDGAASNRFLTAASQSASRKNGSGPIIPHLSAGFSVQPDDLGCADRRLARSCCLWSAGQANTPSGWRNGSHAAAAKSLKQRGESPSDRHLAAGQFPAGSGEFLARGSGEEHRADVVDQMRGLLIDAHRRVVPHAKP